MKAGRLRHRVRIDAVVNGTDALGAPTKDWLSVGEVSAEVSSISGREYFGAGRDLGEETFKITIRQIPGVHIDGTYRVTDVDTTAVYVVTAVLDNHVRDRLVLVCKSGAAHP
jgi:SPP1 family predicted phage head-tail adaptor